MEVFTRVRFVACLHARFLIFLFYYLKLAIIQIYLWRQTHGTEHSEIKILALR